MNGLICLIYGFLAIGDWLEADTRRKRREQAALDAEFDFKCFTYDQIELHQREIDRLKYPRIVPSEQIK